MIHLLMQPQPRGIIEGDGAAACGQLPKPGYWMAVEWSGDPVGLLTTDRHYGPWMGHVCAECAEAVGILIAVPEHN